MLDAQADTPPRDVVQAIARAGKAADPASWRPLGGGRTNHLWRFASGGQTFVCKLFAHHAATPMFPNDPIAEYGALQSLQKSNLAPNPCNLLATRSGAVLIYEYVPGQGALTPSKVAVALSKLHHRTPPAGIRSITPGAQAILNHGHSMLQKLRDPRAHKLRATRPAPVDNGPYQTVFLHGDRVPGNIIAAKNGPCLIDWQCPAIGDPTEDLAIYLSPAMQSLYGGHPLDKIQITAFLAAYGHPDRAARYRQLAPFHHWRMAAYCLWKTNAGDADYSAAADLEIAWLQQFD